MRYKYITDNNLDNRQDYMYSEYGGKDFLDEYKASRLSYIAKYDAETSFRDTRLELEHIKISIAKRNYKYARETLDLYVKRFEVTKRIYTEYNEFWKATNNATYEQLDLYILLSECCMDFYIVSDCTKYLSCSLKVNDTLLSMANRLTCSETKRLIIILKRELAACDEIAVGSERDG